MEVGGRKRMRAQGSDAGGDGFARPGLRPTAAVLLQVGPAVGGLARVGQAEAQGSSRGRTVMIIYALVNLPHRIRKFANEGIRKSVVTSKMLLGPGSRTPRKSRG